MRLLLLLIVVLLLVGTLPRWPYAAGWNWGYYPSGGLGVVLLVLIILILFGYL